MQNTHANSQATHDQAHPVRRFEDLIAWQRARHLTREVYLLTRQPHIARDFGFCNQIQRASASVMSNIAGGSERIHPRAFHQMLCTAKASCAEVRSLMYLALDIAYVDEPTFQTLMAIADETARVIGGLRASIAKRLPA